MVNGDVKLTFDILAHSQRKLVRWGSQFNDVSWTMGIPE